MKTLLHATALLTVLTGLAWMPRAWAQDEPAADRFALTDLLAGDYATGDWLGVREPLQDHGVELFGSYTAEVWGNLSGGERRSAVYTGLLEFGVTLDLEKLVGWPGATVHNSWLWLHGQGPSDRLAGDNLFAVSNIEGFATFRMFELWFQQEVLDGALSLRVGQLAADEEFAISEYAELFMNGTLGWPAFLSESIPNGGPAYPLATPGVRLEINQAEWFTFRTAVFQGDPFAEDVNRHGFRYRLDSANGALLMNEAELRWTTLPGTGLPGSFKTGAWFHTAKFSDPGDEDIERRGNAGFYIIVDQALLQSDSLGEIGTFARLGFEPPDRNFLSFYVDGGVTWQGLLPGRPDDTAGFAVAYGKLSQGARRGLADEGIPNPGYEIALEWTYEAQITPWLAVQPNVQTIIRPGGSREFGNALLLGLRVTMIF